MNLWYKYVPKAITSNVGRQILKTQKGSPTILFVGGVVGVVATTVMASRATLKLKDTLSEHKENLETARTLVHKESNDYDEQSYQRDVTILYSRIAVDTAKLYAPTIAVGAISILALTRSHMILTRRNAALTAAYVALEKGFAEYRKRVVQEFGEETDRRLRYSDMRPVVDQDGNRLAVTTTRTTPNDYSIYARFFDVDNPRFQTEPGYNFYFLRAQQNYANDLLRARGHVFLNEVYDMLGLERTKPGSIVGWIIGPEGDNYVDFGIFNPDHAPARDFVNGFESSILLDFNVDGVIYYKI